MVHSKIHNLNSMSGHYRSLFLYVPSHNIGVVTRHMSLAETSLLDSVLILRDDKNQWLILKAMIINTD